MEDKDDNKCMNLMTGSLYKMQLGVNSIRDELKVQNDILLRIAEALEKNKEPEVTEEKMETEKQ